MSGQQSSTQGTKRKRRQGEYTLITVNGAFEKTKPMALYVAQCVYHMLDLRPSATAK